MVTFKCKTTAVSSAYKSYGSSRESENNYTYLSLLKLNKDHKNTNLDFIKLHVAYIVFSFIFSKKPS